MIWLIPRREMPMDEEPKKAAPGRFISEGQKLVMLGLLQILFWSAACCPPSA
jgi:hypothetical protein